MNSAISVHPIGSQPLSVRLSPPVSDYIRRLIKYSQTPLNNILTLVSNEQEFSRLDLEQILDALYPSTSTVLSVIQRLETLVVLHQTLAFQSFHHSETTQALSTVEQKILDILGFRSD